MLKLEEKKLRENTMVIIWSDHGFAFGEHNGYVCHGIKLYNEFIRIPLLVVFPRKVQVEIRVKGYFQHPDLYPTLFEPASIKISSVVRGKSLLQICFYWVYL